MNKIFCIIVISLSGCTYSEMALVSGGPMAQVNYLSGHGQFNQSPDGVTQFAFSVPIEPAFGMDSTVKSRNAILGNWLGSQKGCPDGYVIDRRTPEVVKGYELIEGHCK